jgi:light-regulated signal transduction histidine kinase (bacteriophytochrome)
MLDMSKIEAGRYELMLEPFDISTVVRSCEAMLGLQAKTKGVSLTSRIQRGLDEVVADQRAIQQILINLVGNAVKFTDAGGAISLDASVRDGILKLCVSDTGIGIAGRQAATARPALRADPERLYPPLRGHGPRPVAGQGTGGAAWRRLRHRQHAGRGHDHHHFDRSGWLGRSGRPAPAITIRSSFRRD